VGNSLTPTVGNSPHRGKWSDPYHGK